MKTLLISLIRAYQFLLSPWLGNQCRFYPTCSAYAVEAIERHGSLKGSWLAAKRLGRCHPWCAGGFDPVPGTNQDAAPCSENDHSGCPQAERDSRLHDQTTKGGNVKWGANNTTSGDTNEPKP